MTTSLHSRLRTPAGALAVLALVLLAGGVLVVAAPGTEAGVTETDGEEPAAGAPPNDTSVDAASTPAGGSADDPSGDGREPESDREPADDPGSSDGERSDEGGADSEPGWSFRVVGTADCGRTCRDVSAALTNEGPRPRENVTVRIEIRAGDDVVWTGREPVGRLGPGETHRTTRRVDVGLFGGIAIENNDGYVTIVTEIASDRATTTERDREKVA